MTTVFSRNAMPKNLLTVQEWMALARHWYGGKNWEHCARKWAAEKGGAIVMRATGALVVFTRLANGKLRRTTYKPTEWAWAV